MVSKKGDMTISFIIFIALGVLVLMLMVYGFTTGWNNMFGNILNLGGGSSNVGSITLACSSAAATNQIHAYCKEIRTLKFGDGKTTKGTCYAFKSKGKISPSETITSCPDSEDKCEDDDNCNGINNKDENAAKDSPVEGESCVGKIGEGGETGSWSNGECYPLGTEITPTSGEYTATDLKCCK